MRISACALILVLGVAPTLSWAQAPPTAKPEPTTAAEPNSDARARELYEQGDRYYSEGRYEKAVEAFRESYSLSKRPLLLFNLANAYERLGRYDEAVTALREYAPSAPEQEREVITKRIDSLELRAKEQAARAQPAPPPPATATPASPPPAAPTADSAAAAPAAPSRPIAGYVLLGSGVVVLGVATVFAAVASGARSDAEEQCPSGVCPVGAQDAVDRDQTFSIMADVGFGVGALAVGAGVLAILLHDPGGSATKSARIAVSPARRGAGVSLVGRY
jgi:hypothetical protein